MSVKRFVPRFFVNRIKMLRDMINLHKIGKSGSKVDNTLPFGVNLWGRMNSGTGLSRCTEILASMLEISGIGYSLKDIYSEKQNDESDYCINIFSQQPSEWGQFGYKNAKKYLDNHINIAYWLWEMPDFPPEWVKAVDSFHEIWAPSQFIVESIRKITDKPVKCIPFGYDMTFFEKTGADYFPDDKKFRCLVMYDVLSCAERKNPYDAIEAYKRSLGKYDDTELIIKINNASYTDEINQLKKMLDGCENVKYITDKMTADDVFRLQKSVDVFISLHRAEGFGLPIAEAMFLKTSVVATGYSANIEFMPDDKDCLVPYTIVKLKKDVGPYRKGNVWAQPDMDFAVKMLERLYKDKDFYDKTICNNYEYVKEKLEIHNTTKQLKERLEEIFAYENSDC